MVEQSQTGTEWVDIVNEDNDVIAQASRAQMRAQRLRHRATYIVVHDGMGKILAQRRTQTKDFLPGMLDATAGGVVQADEPLLDSARREAEEELGIAGVPFAEHGQFYFEDVHCRVWGGLFSCVSHGPFALQEEEISEVCWLTPEEITARCDEFTPDSLKALALWMSRNAGNEPRKIDDTHKENAAKAKKAREAKPSEQEESTVAQVAKNDAATADGEGDKP